MPVTQAEAQTLGPMCMAIFGEYARSAQDAVHAGADRPMSRAFVRVRVRACDGTLSSLYRFLSDCLLKRCYVAAPSGEK